MTNAETFDPEASLAAIAIAAGSPRLAPPPRDELALRRETQILAPFVEQVVRLREVEARAVEKLLGHVAAIEFFQKEDGSFAPVARENFIAARAASDLIEATRAKIEEVGAGARRALHQAAVLVELARSARPADGP